MPDQRHPQHATSNGRSPSEPGLPGLGGFEIFAPLFGNMQAWMRHVTEINASLQREWFGFVEKRLKEDAAFSQCLADCKGPDEVMRTYSEFMRTAFEDYQKEFTTIAKLGGSFASDSIDALRPDGLAMPFLMPNDDFATSGQPAHAQTRSGKRRTAHAADKH